MSRIDLLLTQLSSEREGFLTALDAVDLELVTVPGVVEVESRGPRPGGERSG